MALYKFRIIIIIIIIIISLVLFAAECKICPFLRLIDLYL